MFTLIGLGFYWTYMKFSTEKKLDPDFIILLVFLDCIIITEILETLKFIN